MREPANTTSKPERDESLWSLIVSPIIWAIHFLATYLTAAIWCAKFANSNRPFDEVRVAIGVFTVIALAGIFVNGWGGYRHHKFGGESVPHDDDTPEDRHRFLGFATLLLAGLSAVATLFVAAVAVFVRSCH